MIIGKQIVEHRLFEEYEYLSDEENVFDSMPENLQGSIRGMESEEAIDSMTEAIEYIAEANRDLEDAIELLDGI